jgi:competence protein ComEA
MKDWLRVVLGVAVGIALMAFIQLTTSQPRGTPITITPAPTIVYKVQVDGSVAQPGVYDLPPGSRVQDAIAAAGGFLPDASMEQINLARPLKDGEALHVRSIQPEAAPALPAPTLPAASGLIDLNSATFQELDSLPGIGETRAAAILQYRADHGNFVTIDELLQVPGITRDVFEKLKDLIKVD